MSTGYGWEGIRQAYVRRCLVRAMYLSASAVGRAYKGRYNKCSTFTFTFMVCDDNGIFDAASLCMHLLATIWLSCN